MSVKIKKIRLKNFKKFEDYSIYPNDHINIFVGDNEVGKSTILEAIDLVINKSYKKVDSLGIDKLMNVDAINKFNQSERKFENLPEIRIELYLEGQFDFSIKGKNNLDEKYCDGIRMICTPNDEYINEINSILNASNDYFPYDFYQTKFTTFADDNNMQYKKQIHSVFIDNSNINSSYATNDFIHRMYTQYTENEIKTRAQFQSEYRKMRIDFQENKLNLLNKKVPSNKNYEFGLKSGSSVDLESDLMIYESGVGLDSKGTGKQIFIKTDFALERSNENADIILIEEPENHLSNVNLKKLINKIANATSGQLFITTHNSMICTRLELNNLLIIHPGNMTCTVSLNDLSEETTKYFLKAPPASIVEFSLSDKNILVEGPSEYMLLELFYKTCTGHLPEEDNVHIIDVRGLSFKRYLDVSKLTHCKVGVITDNDKDYQKHCVKKYDDYTKESNIEIFYDYDDNKYTFEILLYESNIELCNELFGKTAQNYMLFNKTESAYALLTCNKTINVPDYIKRAIEWIKN